MQLIQPKLIICDVLDGRFEGVADMRDMAIDPPFPLIMGQIGAAFTAGGGVDPAYAQCAREALALALALALAAAARDRIPGGPLSA